MADAFSREISRVVVGQLAEVAGYESVQDSAAEVLGELLIKYITELSASSHGYAELANRTGINVHDILLALDDLGTSVPELQTYLSSLTPEDNTFAHPLPEYPIQKPGRKLPTFEEKQEAPPRHIPAFLPAFPDKHTYVRTPKFPGHEEDPAKQTQAVQQARRQAEKSLVKLHYSLTNPQASQPGPAPTPATAQQDGAGPGPGATPAAPSATTPAAQQPEATGGATASIGNPFLSPPSTVVVQPGAPNAHTPWMGQGTGPQRRAFVPDAALHAFEAVLPPSLTGGPQNQQEPTDVAAPEEDMELAQEGTVYQEGMLTEPLGSMHDYSTHAFSAAQAASSGKAPSDAYEQAAKAAEEAGGGAGTSAGRHMRNPPRESERRKHPAEEILTINPRDIDKAMEGEEEAQ